MQDAKYDNAMRQVISQLRQAREYAIANRRYVQVTFPTVVIANQPTQYQVVTTERNAPPLGPAGVELTPYSALCRFKSQRSFFCFQALRILRTVSETPAAIEFEGLNPGPVSGMLFQSDGELVDGATFQPINGTVFIGFPNQATASRAVTVLGATGRVRGWKYTGAAWFQF